MIWFFDLDNTLHNTSQDIFPRISENMNRYIAWNCAGNEQMLDIEKADQLRKTYWKKYGATLLGISKKMDQKAISFLKVAHKFDHLNKMVHRERGLNSFFRNLSGNKIIFTNSSISYCKQVLAILGIKNYIKKQIAIESMQIFGQLSPKPSKRLLLQIISKMGLTPQNCVLVEDSKASLKVAKSIGMKTVLVTQYLNSTQNQFHAYPFELKKQVGRPTYIDWKVRSVLQIKHQINQIF